MDQEEIARLLRSVAETNELIAPMLRSLNQAPVPVAADAPAAAPAAGGVATAAAPAPAAPAAIIASQPAAGVSLQSGLTNVLSLGDQIAMRAALRQRSTQELHALFSQQAMQRGTGIPLDTWLAAGGSARLQRFAGIENQVTPDVMRALDSAGAAAVIRQDLEPILYELYVREFPAWERFTKEPANGLTHTFQRQTSFGDAAFMSELGTVTDDRGVYERDTTNVAIIATRRGVSLKSQFATIQSGSGFNPEQLELTAGLRAVAHRMQVQIFSGHGTDSGGTSSNELGAYDANAFTGLRSILNTARAKNVQFDLDATTDPFRIGVNDAAVEIMNASPGRPGIIYLNPIDKARYDESQDKNVRYVSNLKNVAPGVETNAVNSVFGDIPLYPVPGDAISAYTTTSGGSHSVRDAYLLDESSITLPYLGSEGLTVLEIPVGISGQLVKLYIIFGMFGLAVKAVIYSNKLRLHTTLA